MTLPPVKPPRSDPVSSMAGRCVALCMGLAAIGVSVVLPAGLLVRITVLASGVLLFAAALLTLGRAMPSPRRYVAFRAEVEYFLDLARELNWAAAAVAPGESPEDTPRVREIRRGMIESVERMVRYAGRTPRQMDAIDVFIEHELDPVRPSVRPETRRSVEEAGSPGPILRA